MADDKRGEESDEEKRQKEVERGDHPGVDLHEEHPTTELRVAQLPQQHRETVLGHGDHLKLKKPAQRINREISLATEKK